MLKRYLHSMVVVASLFSVNAFANAQTARFLCWVPEGGGATGRVIQIPLYQVVNWQEACRAAGHAGPHEDGVVMPVRSSNSPERAVDVFQWHPNGEWKYMGRSNNHPNYHWVNVYTRIVHSNTYTEIRSPYIWVQEE